MSTDTTQGVDRGEGQVPEPDDPRKPDSPTDLTKRSWFYVLRKTLREFMDDQCTDLAAALTYYAVLSIFPAAIALVSLLGVVGEAEESVDTVVEVLAPVVSPETLGTVEDTLRTVAENQAAGWLLVVGLLGALWTASGYIGAFGRAMNRIYEVGEGRPVWKLRPLQVLITVLAILMLALALVLLAVSGPLAESIGDVLGVGDTVVTVWSHRQVAGARARRHADHRAALLRHPQRQAAQVPLALGGCGRRPGRRRPRVRGLLLLRRQLRQLQQDLRLAGRRGRHAAVPLDRQPRAPVRRRAGCRARDGVGSCRPGIPAEEELQLPARDTRGIKKAEKKQAKDAALGRRIREQAAEPWPPPDRSRPSEADDKTTGKHKEDS